jgi:hypothetical protein
LTDGPETCVDVPVYREFELDAVFSGTGRDLNDDSDSPFVK